MVTSFNDFPLYAAAKYCTTQKDMDLVPNGMLISAVHTEKGEEQLNLLMIDDKIPAGAKMC